MGPLQAQKRGFGGPIGGLNNTKSWNIPTVTYQIKGFSLLMKIKMKKLVSWSWVWPRAPKRVFGPIRGPNFKKSSNIPIVTYQIKGFDSLMKIKIKKNSNFGALGPAQGPKMSLREQIQVQLYKVTKHTYCDIKLKDLTHLIRLKWKEFGALGTVQEWIKRGLTANCGVQLYKFLKYWCDLSNNFED